MTIIIGDRPKDENGRFDGSFDGSRQPVRPTYSVWPHVAASIVHVQHGKVLIPPGILVPRLPSWSICCKAADGRRDPA